MALRASELRIGNFVTDEFYDTFKSVIIVTSINEKGVNLEVANSDDYPEMQDHWIEPYYEFEKLRGIPLTEEWLVKFGFELQMWGGEYTKAGSLVSLHKVGGDHSIHQIRYANVGMLQCFPKYVHQLQNLYFALTGEELPIKEL